MSDKKPSEILKDWPEADIDSGIFKYVLIELYATDPDQPETEHSKLIVRGKLSAEYHADVYDAEEELIRGKGLDSQCLGGGRIEHDSAKKYIRVYGYSVGFGRAQHTKSVDILKKKYPEYTIEWSDEGY